MPDVPASDETPSEIGDRTGAEVEAALARALGGLLRRAHLVSPSDLASLVAEEAAALGAEEVVLYRLDYGQTELVPVPSPQAADRGQLPVDGTFAGRAFTVSTVLEGDALGPGRRRLWVPLLDGTERLGLMELTFTVDAGPVPEPLREAAQRYAALVAELVLTKGEYGDVFEYLRRRRALPVAAEIQRQLLPPLTFATESLVIAGAVEPAYQVAGDSLDYAVNGDVAHFALFDAMGHGLDSAMLCTVAVGAYRNARRSLLGLADAYRCMSETLVEYGGGTRFVTAVLAELELGTGRLSWVSAGHPPMLLLRRGRLVRVLEAPPAVPLGLDVDADPPVVATEELEPEDRVLAYTDGVVEARSGLGEFFTVERLADFVIRESAAGAPPPETLRRLTRAILAHQKDVLQDDATTLLVEWLGHSGPALLP